MKASRYNVRVPAPGGGTLLFNAATAALAHLGPADEPVVAHILAGSPASNDAETGLSATLREEGFLVEDDADELAAQRADSQRARIGSRSFLLTVAPTLACNFACDYCFERTAAGPPMSEETERALLAFCRKRLAGAEDLLVNWFGGEPTLLLGTIERLNPALAEAAARHGVEVRPGEIVTNGWLLDESVARRLAAAGILEAQITLDGPEPIHDARRRLPDGHGTFARILRGIEESAAHLNITIRVNLDRRNEASAPDLLETLDRRALLNRVGVYFAPVLDDNPSCGGLHGRCFGSAEFPEKLAALHERLFSEGRAQIGYPEVAGGSACGADTDLAFVVGPDGTLFKCWEDLTDLGTSVGSVHAEEPEPWQRRNSERYLTWDPFEKSGCRECEVLPLCMGCCPRRAIRLDLPDRGYCCAWKHNLGPMLVLRHRAEGGEEANPAGPGS
jgi:uncharacterized protein